MKRTQMAGGLKAMRGKGKTSMHMEVGKFNQHVMTKLIPKAKIATADAVVLIALEVDGRIMLAWPVKSGRSRAAWSVFLDKHGEPTPDLGDDSVAISEGKGMGDVKENLKGLTPSIELINGVEYSPALEVGWSKQAPGGVVRKVLRSVRTGKTREAFIKTFKKVK